MRHSKGPEFDGAGNNVETRKTPRCVNRAAEYDNHNMQHRNTYLVTIVGHLYCGYVSRMPAMSKINARKRGAGGKVIGP